MKKGDYCVVETVRGRELGKVVTPPEERDEKQFNNPLRKVIRVATEEDLENDRKNREKGQRPLNGAK